MKSSKYGWTAALLLKRPVLDGMHPERVLLL